MLLGPWSISVTLTLSNQFTMHTCILLQNMEKFFVITLPTVGRFSLYKRKLSELWLQNKTVRIMADSQPRTSCRSLFQQLEILPVPCQLILSPSIIRKFFKQIHLYTILIQEKSTIFIDQIPTYLVYKKAHSVLA